MAAFSPEPEVESEFNTKVKDGIGHVAKHVLVMGAIMGIIAVASPAFAAAIPADPTIGDFAVQMAHGSWEMLMMIGDALQSTLASGWGLIENTFQGNIVPGTYDSMVMSHSGGAHAMHAAEAGMSHTVQAAGAHASHAGHAASASVELTGNLVTPADGAHAVHAAHAHEAVGGLEAASHATHVGLEAQIDQFSAWTENLSPAELSEIKEEANLIYGQTLFEYFQGNFLDHGL